MAENLIPGAFPAFTSFVREHRLAEKAQRKGGYLPVQLLKVLGEGHTTADGLALPPATFERRQAFIKLKLDELAGLGKLDIPETIINERKEAQAEHEADTKALLGPDGWERVARRALQSLPEPKGAHGGVYHCGALSLVFDRRTFQFSWCFTRYYRIVGQVPPDSEYIGAAHSHATELYNSQLLPPPEFLRRLNLAWILAKHQGDGEKVLLRDVARMFQVAAQNDNFWKRPSKQTIQNIPEGMFPANLHVARDEVRAQYVLERATLHQEDRSYHLPANQYATETTPYIYIEPVKR